MVTTLNVQLLDRPRVDRFARRAEGQWLLTVATGLGSALSLPSTECELKLQDVYRKVTFPEAAGPRR
jgi:hypothetical protein